MTDQIDVLVQPAPLARSEQRRQPNATDDARRMPLVLLCVLALVVGIVTGLGAVRVPRADRLSSTT